MASASRVPLFVRVSQGYASHEQYKELLERELVFLRKKEPNADRDARIAFLQAELFLRSFSATATKDVLIIHTGGTIGSSIDKEEKRVNATEQFFSLTWRSLPPLARQPLVVDVIEPFTSNGTTGFDSSCLEPEQHWPVLAQLIHDHLGEYRGVVVTHGTDTLAYTAAALSFMLQDLRRPVVVTAAQVPLSVLLSGLPSDAEQNLMTACLVAAHRNSPLIPEVTVAFNGKLFRGNRVSKVDANGLDAFDSPKAHHIGSFGSDGVWHFDTHLTRRICWKRLNARFATFPGNGAVKLLPRRDRTNWAKVAMVHSFPGISKDFLDRVLAVGAIEGIIVQTYGTGNAPPSVASYEKPGALLLNCTECQRGMVQAIYGTSVKTMKSLRDMTPAAAFAKLWVFLNYKFTQQPEPSFEKEKEKFYSFVGDEMTKSYRGEVSSSNDWENSSPSS